MKKNIKSSVSYNILPSLDFEVEFQAYDCSHQKASEIPGKWIPDGPNRFYVNIKNITDIRETTENDLNDEIAWNCYFPTDYCTLEYYDKWNKNYNKKLIVGKSKDIIKIVYENKPNLITDKTNEKNNINEDLENLFKYDINDIFEEEENENENEESNSELE